MICTTKANQPAPPTPKFFEEAIAFLDSGELAEADGYQAEHLVRPLFSAFINLLSREQPERAARLSPWQLDSRWYEPPYVDHSLLAKVKAIETFTDEVELNREDANRLYELLTDWWRELESRGRFISELKDQVPRDLRDRN